MDKINQDQYKAAIDSIKFSETFERDTTLLLQVAAEQKLKKEISSMKNHKILGIPALSAILIVVFAVSAFALTALLAPKDVATQAGDMALAEAFDSKDALIIDQSVETGEYIINLAGIVSGKDLSSYYEEAQDDKSYIVASVSYADGLEIKQAGEAEITFSPLVEGYKPWQINAWTLGGGYQSFVYEGVNYYIFECSNLEIFADHIVYLAAFQGGGPNADTFTINEDGKIAFVDGFDAPHAMFTIPLDPGKADPAAAKQLLESIGL